MDASVVETMRCGKDVSPDYRTSALIQLTASAGCVDMSKSLHFSGLGSAFWRFYVCVCSICIRLVMWGLRHGSGIKQPDLNPCPSLAICMTWGNFLASSRVGFLTFEMRIFVVPTSYGLRITWNEYSIKYQLISIKGKVGQFQGPSAV